MNETKKIQLNRPQQPQRPFSYHEEEVTYQNSAADITLAGTFTRPANQTNAPVVILVPGYGKLTRDLSIMGHDYFLVLADHLTRQGIAVLRYDKRGVGASTGDYASATTIDFASDVKAGIAYLKTRTDIDSTKIGLIGSSEGGLISAIVATENPDIAYTVLLAPAVCTTKDMILDAAAAQLHADGALDEFIEQNRSISNSIYSIALNEPDTAKAAEQMRTALHDYFAALSPEDKKATEMFPFAFAESKAEKTIAEYNGPWYRFYLSLNPEIYLEQLKTPVLMLHGNRDYIVLAKDALAVAKRALKKAGNVDYALQELPNINHLFQTCKTGSLKEYGTLEETMSPVVLSTISDWILARTR